MSTTPEQRTLTAGSHWMRVIDPANWIYHFGYVWFDVPRLNLIAGNLDSFVVSRLNRDGWNETVHASEVWPISESLYLSVRSSAWDVRNMNKVSDAYEELVKVFAAILRHNEDQRRHTRRDFAWFVAEVESVANWMASTDYRGFNRIADRRVVLRFSRWGNVHGAQRELDLRGFVTAKVYPSALDVLDRSEA